MEKIIRVLKMFKNCEIDIMGLFDRIGNFFDKIFALELLSPVVSKFESVFDGSLKYVLYILLGLLVAALGQRLLGIGKVVFAALVGFGVGYIYLPAFLSFVPAMLGGLAGAVVCVILTKLVYLAFLAGVTAYPAYFVLYTGAISSLAFATKSLVVSAAVAAVAAFVVIIFRKSIVEKVATAFLGAYIAVYNLLPLFDPRTLGILEGDLLLYVILCVIALVGLLVQIKTRKRY